MRCLIRIMAWLLTLPCDIFSFLVLCFFLHVNLNVWPKPAGFINFDYSSLPSQSFLSVLPHVILFYIWLFKITGCFSSEFHQSYRKFLFIRYLLLKRVQAFCSMFKAVIANLKLTWFLGFISESNHFPNKIFLSDHEGNKWSKRTVKTWPLLWVQYDISLLNYIKCAIEK